MLPVLPDFNSRTHVECDLGLYYHSPSFLSFQLTHSRGVRPTNATTIWGIACTFQLTHSRGVRPLVINLLVRNKRFQLTHSRGVRLNFSFAFRNIAYFNSRTHVECDHFIFLLRICSFNFNSRGVRRFLHTSMN